MDEDCKDSVPANVQELWLDMDTNRSYILRSGRSAETDCMGQPLKHFVPYCTGTATSTQRKQLSISLKSPFQRSSRIKSIPIPSPLASIFNATTTLYRPTVNRLRGFTMFPRPLSLPYCNSHAKSSISPAKRYAFHNGTRPNKEIVSCSFFTPKVERRCGSPAKLSAEHRRMNTTGFCEFLGSEAETKKFMKPRETLRSSFIKSKYASALKATFTPCKNMRKVSEETRRMIMLPNTLEEESVATRRKCNKSFVEVQYELRQQELEAKGFCEKEKKGSPISFKGLYSVKVPTEGELYNKAVSWRKRLNPKAASKEAEIIERDKFLFEKRHKRNELKYKLMHSIMRHRQANLQ